MRIVFSWTIMCLAFPVLAAERSFPFADLPLDQAPPGFRSVASGKTAAGDWKIILDEVAPLLAPLTPHAPSVARRPVLGQLARNGTEANCPMLIDQGDAYLDFKFSARCKLAGGALGQAAGLVFRFQNESNYYVAQVSAAAGRFQCFRVVNGELKPPLGPEIKIEPGDWHELAVQCEGPRIVCSLDGQDGIKLIDNFGVNAGRVGFWTKADTVAYFSDAKVLFERKEPLAQTLVQDALEAYPRVLGLNVYAIPAGGTQPVVIAAKQPDDLGGTGGKAEQDAISGGTGSIAKGKGQVTVTLPLRDRNGEAIGAVRVVLKSVVGQTEQNALIRAQPVVRGIQARVQSREDLLH